MNCKETHETLNADLTTPGIIFSDVNETLWTVTQGKPFSTVSAQWLKKASMQRR
jgi:hypothetical protein